MNALTAVAEQSNALGPITLVDGATVAVRLADEGIPIRAIARALHIPSGELYEMLNDAIAVGTIVELPKDDWPVGSQRTSRTVFYGTPLEHETALVCACARTFKTSPLEAAMLALLLRRNEATKDQLHTVIEQNRPTMGKEPVDQKMVDVMICKLRKKIKPHGVTIDTMWGIGYHMTSENRERCSALLMKAQANG